MLSTKRDRLTRDDPLGETHIDLSTLDARGAPVHEFDLELVRKLCLFIFVQKIFIDIQNIHRKEAKEATSRFP